jgi:chromosome segregation ATPase
MSPDMAKIISGLGPLAGGAATWVGNKLFEKRKQRKTRQQGGIEALLNQMISNNRQLADQLDVAQERIATLRSENADIAAKYWELSEELRKQSTLSTTIVETAKKATTP